MWTPPEKIAPGRVVCFSSAVQGIHPTIVLTNVYPKLNRNLGGVSKNMAQNKAAGGTFPFWTPIFEPRFQPEAGPMGSAPRRVSRGSAPRPSSGARCWRSGCAPIRGKARGFPPLGVRAALVAPKNPRQLRSASAVYGRHWGVSRCPARALSLSWLPSEIFRAGC